MTRRDGVQALVRRTHEERVLRALREHGALSRAQIARLVGLSRTTLSEITGGLLRRGTIIVTETDADERVGSGRPAERLALDPASGQYIGADFGHRRVHVVVVNAAQEVIAGGTARYADDATWGERLDAAFGVLDGLSSATGVHFGAVQSIGIGVPGPFPSASATGPLRHAGWGVQASAEGVDAAFSDRFGAPVVVDSNTRFAALSEALRHEPGAVRDLLYVRLGDGVGGGSVVDGRLVTGRTGLAGEFGHVTAVPWGARCRCGKRGCLETVASVPAVLARCAVRGAPVADLDALGQAVLAQDPVVTEVLRDAGDAVGRVLGAAAMVLNPQEIVVGGELAHVAPPLFRQVAVSAALELFPLASGRPTIRLAGRSELGGALGAVAALFRRSPVLSGYPDFSELPAPVIPLRRSHP